MLYLCTLENREMEILVDCKTYKLKELGIKLFLVWFLVLNGANHMMLQLDLSIVWISFYRMKLLLKKSLLLIMLRKDMRKQILHSLSCSKFLVRDPLER